MTIKTLVATALTALSILSAAGLAHAETVITRPTWESIPSNETMAAHYPQQALEQGKGGRAVLECGVDNSGLLQACRVVSESPENQRFGTAALAAAWEFRMKPKTIDGVPVGGGTTRVPIRFQIEEDAAGDQAFAERWIAGTGEGAFVVLVASLLVFALLANILLYVWPLTRIYKAAGVARGFAWLWMIPGVNIVALWIAAAQVKDD